jgi:hypothetical protein
MIMASRFKLSNRYKCFLSPSRLGFQSFKDKKPMPRFTLLILTLFLSNVSVVGQTSGPPSEPGAEFNRCLADLGPADRVDPGVATILEEVSRLDAYKNTGWNINSPYLATAINLLVPQAHAIWPASCDMVGHLPAEPAGCESFPAEGYVICNPSMGSQFASPLIHSGIANVETNFAKRFILLTFLGHELGHLSFHSSEKHNLVPWTQPYGMTCDQRTLPNAPTEEERAEEFGVVVACAALRKSPDFGLVPNDQEGMVTVLQRLQDDLDDSYFTTDDACVRSGSYPSISRRKHTFSRAYVKCLYPQGWNPIVAVADDDASSFDRVEEWLKKRQLSGFVGSGSYGKKALFSHQVFKDRRSYYLTFDSSGLDSTLWYVARPSGGLVTQPILKWPVAGEAVWGEDAKNGLKIFVLLDSSGTSDTKLLVEVNVDCGEGDGSPCRSHVRNRDLEPGTEFLTGPDGTVATQSPEYLEKFGSFDDFLNGGHGAITRVSGLPTDPEKSATAVSKDRTVVIAKSTGGFYSATSVQGSTVSKRALFVFPSEAGTVEAAMLLGGRLFLSIFELPLTGNGRLNLWDCPSNVLDTGSKTITRSCAVYEGPQELQYNVAMTTRNLSSLLAHSIEPSPESCGNQLLVKHDGWIWLLNRARHEQTTVIADGVVSCDPRDNYIETYRARRIDHITVEPTPVKVKPKPLTSLPQNAK